MKESQRQLQQDTKQEVIKHSAAIQIENNMTLLQRRAWNALLFHAYNELDKKEEHQISLQYLAHLVGYDSHDMEYLKEASLAMLRCIVQYNVLGKDGSLERWGATALLAQADMQKKKACSSTPTVRSCAAACTIRKCMRASLLTCKNNLTANMRWRCGNCVPIIWARAVNMEKRLLSRWKLSVGLWA